ncbi:hypothetical protein VD0002_g7348 [Verticillium dahliae]|nr:hypothetical protein VD0003_g8300 [Verticillium dahliae]PNH60277.1 hypothetical protein VD0002_g7348 [Verticillium dahliae]
MQVNLNHIDFYQPSTPTFSLSSYKTSNGQRLSTLALPTIPAPSAPTGQAEQPELQYREPAFQDVIEIPDDDASNDDGDTPTSLTPGPNGQAVVADANGPLSPQIAFAFMCEPNSDLDFHHHRVEDSPQPRETPRDDSASAGDHDLPLKPCARHPPSLAPKHPVLVSGHSGFDDDQGMEVAQHPSSPVPGAGFDPVHPLPRQSDMLCHPPVHIARINSGPDVAVQEGARVPSCPDTEALDQILDGTADEGETRPAVAVDANEGTPMSASPPPPASLLSRLPPPIPAGSQSAQPDPQGTICARGDANSPDTAGSSSYVSKDPATPTRPSPCDDGSASQPITTPRLQARGNDLLSPPKLKQTRRTYPAKNNAQRQSSRPRAASRNAARAFSQLEADRSSDLNDGSSSEDGTGSDESYTARSADSAGEADDGSMDEYDSPAPKRRKQSSAQATAARRRTPRRSSSLSAASTSGGDVDSARTRGIASPPSSSRHSSARGSVAEGPIARFEEWPLQDVALKRVTENGVAISQLQFSWDPRTDHRRDHPHPEPRVPVRSIRKRDTKKQASSSGAPFTEREDRCLIRLKEQGGLPWTEIHKSFTDSFPGRSQGALQVRYYTKLKGKSGDQQNAGGGQRTS